MICKFTLFMDCDLLYLLVKCSHELEGIMAIYDNMRTNALVQLIIRCNFCLNWFGDCVQCFEMFLDQIQLLPNISCELTNTYQI